MERRVAGLVTVALTLISVLVINGAVGRVLGGSARRLPVPIPPAAGTCLRQSPSEWTATRCDAVHTAEVAQSWPAVRLPAMDLYEACMAAGRTYLTGPSAASPDGQYSGQSTWSAPSVMTTTTLAHGPGAALTNGWSWQACIVRPILPDPNTVGYRGRLRDASASGSLPVELRPCFILPEGIGPVGTSCAVSHAGEVLAGRTLEMFGLNNQFEAVATDPEINAQCVEIARRVTGSADPTYGGTLAVVVNLRATGMGFQLSPGAGKKPPSSRSYTLYQANCSLEAAAGRQLYASLVGLGAASPPLR